jgi:hypothetical protein
LICQNQSLFELFSIGAITEIDLLPLELVLNRRGVASEKQRILVTADDTTDSLRSILSTCPAVIRQCEETDRHDVLPECMDLRPRWINVENLRSREGVIIHFP